MCDCLRKKRHGSFTVLGRYQLFGCDQLKVLIARETLTDGGSLEAGMDFGIFIGGGEVFVFQRIPRSYKIIACTTIQRNSAQNLFFFLPSRSFSV